jgi:hypothetical protein
METEMESQLRGASSGQPQLFAEIAQCHDFARSSRTTPSVLLQSCAPGSRCLCFFEILKNVFVHCLVPKK